MKKWILSFFCLSIAGWVSGGTFIKVSSKNPDTIKIKKIIKQIAKENFYQIESDSQSRQNENFQKFQQSGTTFDFLKIAMEDKNPIVRLYAFKAVAARMDEIPLELITKFRNDSSMITVRYKDSVKEVPINQIANGFLN